MSSRQLRIILSFLFALFAVSHQVVAAPVQVAGDPVILVEELPEQTPGVSSKESLSSRARMFADQMRAQGLDFLPDAPPPTIVLRPGDEGPGVAWLAQALYAHGYLMPAEPVQSAQSIVFSEVFDDAVAQALEAFQADQGLQVDAVAGPQTFAALAADSTRVASALDEWASSLDTWSDQFYRAGYDRIIVVNIPSYTLHAIDLNTGRVDLESRVIVGRPSTRTPRMLTRIVNLKANPDWTPPKSIRGARYQPPGPNNALGLMRFSTDNHMNIYLHDTNARHLFDRDTRALSHGCVRVDRWHELSSWSARETSQWVDEVALVGGRTRFLRVDPIPVLLVYSLVDVVDGIPRQFPDVYDQRDRAIGYASLNGQEAPLPVLFKVTPQSSVQVP